ncbi:MAG: Crp/Fnr family transcriptional regulator [Pseudomonadota bacterium]
MSHTDHPGIVTDIRPSATACALVRKLGTMTLLSEEEVQYLDGLHTNRVSVAKGVDFIEDGQDFAATFIVMRGWVVRYALTQDGKRQILSFALPGDILGFHSNFRRTASYSAAALVDTELAAVEPTRMVEISRQFPVLAAGLSWSTAREFSILGDQALRLGRLTAYERVSHILLELWHRLRLVGETDQHWMDLPMTQNDLADALGLSIVHINRQLRRLRSEGLITIVNDCVRLEDIERLIDVSGFQRDHLTEFRL